MEDRCAAGSTGAADTLAAATAMDARLAALLVDAVQEYAIFALDQDGNVVTWNKGAGRIKGYGAAEIIGRHFSVFYTPDDVRADKPQRQLQRAREHGYSRDEGWRIRKDGSRFWANVTITAIHDSKGRLEGYAKVTRDETDRKHIEEQVRQLELLTDRERIAHQMHETIVNLIFEASASLASALTRVHDPVATARVRAALETLDATLREIRTIVFNARESRS